MNGLEMHVFSCVINVQKACAVAVFDLCACNHVFILMRDASRFVSIAMLTQKLLILL